MATLKILNGKQTAENYPYGYTLKCTRTMEIEYKYGKGCRVMTQTTNPKNNHKLNAPKRSTYYPYAILFENEETGHTDYKIYSFDSMKAINRFTEMLRDNKDQLKFEPKQEFEIWQSIIASIKITAEWTKFKIAKEGEPMTALKFLEACRYKELIKFYGSSAPITELLTLDLDFVAIHESFKDDINGEAIKSYRIASAS